MKRRSSNASRGFFTVLGAVLVFAMLAVAGLAVDSAQLYRAHLRLRRALDAGATAASKLIGTPDENKAPAIAREIARDNLKGMGFTAAQITDLQGTWIAGSNNTAIHLTGTIRLNTLIIQVVPGLGPLANVSADAEAVNQRAVIAYVLDVSGSMIRMPDGLVTKIDRLRDAVHDSLGDTAHPTKGVFSPGQDYIGIVTFSSTARVPTGGQITTNFLPFWDNVINTPLLNPGGTTNPQMALRIAAYMIRNWTGLSSAQLAAANKAIILITDGAPTYSCSTVSVSGPSSTPVYTTSGCGDSGTSNYDRAIIAADAARTIDSDPAHDIAIYSIGIGQLVGDAAHTPAQLEAADAYQNVSDTSDGSFPAVPLKPAVKSNFLRRVANVAPPGGIEPTAYFGSGILRYAPYNATRTPAPPDGLYYATATAANLKDLLRDIALSIKGRLVK